MQHDFRLLGFDYQQHCLSASHNTIQSGFNGSTVLQIEKATAARFKREGRSVLLQWQCTAHRRRRHKAVLQQSATRLHLRCLRQVMQEWHHQIWKAIAVRRVAQFVQTHRLRPAFAAWKKSPLLELAVAKAKHMSTRRCAPCLLQYSC